MPSWTFPKCKIAHAWRRRFRSATGSHCTGLKSDVRTSAPTQPGRVRSWKRTSHLAMPTARRRSQPGRHPLSGDRCRARRGHPRSRHGSHPPGIGRRRRIASEAIRSPVTLRHEPQVRWMHPNRCGARAGRRGWLCEPHANGHSARMGSHMPIASVGIPIRRYARIATD